jgi:hypothetical protein
MVPCSGGTLLDKPCGSVQKLCSEIMGLLQYAKAFENVSGRVDSLGLVVFPSYLFETVTSGEIGRKAGAEGATAPETLRQKDRVTRTASGKRRLGLRAKP